MPQKDGQELLQAPTAKARLRKWVDEAIGKEAKGSAGNNGQSIERGPKGDGTRQLFQVLAAEAGSDMSIKEAVLA